MLHKVQLHNMLEDVTDTIKYDLLKLSPPKLPLQAIRSIPSKVRFVVRANDSRGIVVQSSDNPEITISADRVEDLPEVIHDYFMVSLDIPRYHMKRILNTSRIETSSGKVLYPKQKLSPQEELQYILR